MSSKRHLRDKGRCWGRGRGETGADKCYYLLRLTSYFSGLSSREFEADASRSAEVTIKMDKDQGVLQLGKLSQKYIEDSDLRALLAITYLDSKKMEPYEDDELLLITSVIYSEKVEQKMNGMHEVFIL